MASKTPSQIADEAETMAQSFAFVVYEDVLYIPEDYETHERDTTPDPERTSWVPMSDEHMQRLAKDQFNTIFKDPAQTRSFIYQVKQGAIPVDEPRSSLLIKTTSGLRVLKDDGTLDKPTGEFMPNTLPVTLNESEADKEEVLRVITEWVGGDAGEAVSLLRHLATALAPHWSSGKYILLIGKGRNGKSVMTHMLHDMLGVNNCSRVTRQAISTGEVNIFDLNGKLMNIVFDGASGYLKDSGNEKSLITGESVGVRKLWGGTTSLVQSNALFIEGLNQEPKSKDKSSALQARLQRFYFPNKYADDLGFMRHMRSERMLGALLALLIDHYVKDTELAVMLAPTKRSKELMYEHMEANSLAVQYILHVDDTDPLGASSLIGKPLMLVYPEFCSWRIKLNDLRTWEKADVFELFRLVAHTDRRKSVRIPNVGPRKVESITDWTEDMSGLLEAKKELEDATVLVDEGPV